MMQYYAFVYVTLASLEVIKKISRQEFKSQPFFVILTKFWFLCGIYSNSYSELFTFVAK